MDNAAKEVESIIRKKPRHVTPSVKQIKALQLISQGYSRRRAMIEAGYSLQTANHSSSLIVKSKAAKQLTEAMKAGLVEHGLDVDFFIKKFKKWVNAKKSDDDDYPTQQRAYKDWKEIMEPKDEEGRKPTRKITFEEFIEEPNETKL